MSSHLKPIEISAARDGTPGELAVLLGEMALRCRAEAGNLLWNVWQDKAEDRRYILDGLHAAATHRATPHYQNRFSRVLTLAQRAAFMRVPTLEERPPV